jgi:hypothetical protein
MFCLNCASIEVEKNDIKGENGPLIKRFGNITFSSTQAIVVCGSCGAGGTGRPFRINGRTDPIASWSIVANVEPVIGKSWSKNLNK